MIFNKLLVLLIFTIASNSTITAKTHDGTISKLRGHVEILKGGSLSLSGEGPHVKYKSKFYTLKIAKIGDKIRTGQIVRTGKRSIAKIIFENGDQFIISPGSEYVLKLPEKSKSSNSFINLTRGKFRAVISKDGPRNKLNIKTRNASMGVRGTDFYVNAKGYDRSEVSVLRGKVVLKTQKSSKKKVVNIDTKTNKKTEGDSKSEEVVLETGYSANLVSTPKLPILLENDKKKINETAKQEIKETLVEVKKTSKQKLITIQKATVIESKKDDPPVSQETKNSIQKLEKKAIEVTLKDIKTYTPNLYQKIKDSKSPIVDTESLNTKVVVEAHKVAPKAIKPDLDDLDNDDLSDDAYNKYFKGN